MTTSNKYLFLILIIIILFSCNLEIENESTRIETDELLPKEVCQNEDYDKLILLSINSSSFEHPFPSLINRLRRRYVETTNDNFSNDNLSLVTIDTLNNGNRVHLDIYLVEDKPILIDRLLFYKQKQVVSEETVVKDSVITREIYYISTTCCVREQLSHGCANMSRASYENSLCENIINNYVHILAE